MRKRLCSLVLLCILTVCICLSDFSSIVACAEGNANDRQRAYIEFASNRVKVGDLSVNNLTKDEMRILGVFLSNFYIPFGTQLVQTDDDELARKNMVSALTEELNFDSTLASDIVDAVFQMSVNTASKLNARVTYTPVYSDNSIGEPESLDYSCFSYMDLMCFLYYREKLEYSSVGGLTKYIDFSTAKLELYYGNGYSSSRVVLEIDNRVGNNPCKMALLQSLCNLNLDRGYGSNLFSLPSEYEGKNYDENNVKDIADLVNTNEDFLGISSFGWQLYVDCFGNIIVDCGTGKQYIIEPACMNPYTWVKDGYKAGECLPMNNLGIISATYNNQVVKSEDSINQVLNGVIPEINYWRLVRGSSDSDASSFWGKITHFFGFDNDGYSCVESLLAIYNQSNHMFSSRGAQNIVQEGASISSVPLPSGRVFTNSSIGVDNTIQDFIFFDTLNAFNTNTSMSINEYGIFSDDAGTCLGSFSEDTFKNCLFSPENNTLVTIDSDEQKKYIAGIYCAYVFAYFERESVSDGGHVNFRFNMNGLPEIGSGNISLTDTSMSDMQEEVITMSYLLLHPDEGGGYLRKMFTNKVNAVVLGWHEDLVGNTNTGSSTGATKYLGVSGYMTTPEIKDFEWLNSLYNFYINNSVYILIFVIIVTVLYVMSGTLSFQKAVLNSIIFSVCVLFLPLVITSVVSYSNRLSNSFYGNKFQYWGLVQHQAYKEDLDSAVQQENYNDYLITLFNQQNVRNKSNVVTLKWMCPKKDNYLVNIESEMSESVNSSTLNVMLRGVVGNQTSGEDYTNSANNTYLYRGYTDLASYAEVYYNSAGTSGKQLEGIDSLNNINLSEGLSFLDLYKNYLSELDDKNCLGLSETFGFNFNTSLSDFTNKRFAYMNRSSVISNALNVDFTSVTDSYTYFGVPQSYYNYTLANFNSSETIPDKNVSIGIFGLYSESPFYYLNWNLRDQLNSSRLSSSYPVKSLLLSSDNGLNSYFYNMSSNAKGTDSYGQLRDYMDMKSLFTIVIPYLKKCNDVVIQFDSQYGLEMLSSYKVEYTTDENGNMHLRVPTGLESLSTENKDEFYKYWHDVQVSNLFNMYTPWVDTLYSCKYANQETISVAGKEYVVPDPLNPNSYPECRPMIFSESEKVYYGLSDANLTSVEKRILKLNEKCYKSLATIMNYYTFDTDVLITAVSMMETFEFNRQFSEQHLLSESNVLYPQCFELKNFSFDAYFRLILSETVKQDLNSSKSIYETVVENTSVFTGLLLLIVDISAVWFIPFLRLSFVVLIGIVGILTICCSCIKDTSNIKELLNTLGTSVFLPLVKFLIVTVVSAFVISLFLSSGYTGITGSLDYTISLGDPIMAMLLLLVINIAVTVCYVIILKSMFNDTKSKFKSLKTSVLSVGAGLIAVGTSAVTSKVSTGISDTGVPSSSVSGELTPKLKVKTSGASATNRLARRQLLERDVNNVKNVGKTVTKPIRTVGSAIKNGFSRSNDVSSNVQVSTVETVKPVLTTTTSIETNKKMEDLARRRQVRGESLKSAINDYKKSSSSYTNKEQSKPKRRNVAKQKRKKN